MIDEDEIFKAMQAYKHELPYSTEIIEGRLLRVVISSGFMAGVRWAIARLASMEKEEKQEAPPHSDGETSTEVVSNESSEGISLIPESLLESLKSKQ